jgi:hypothetical protein
MTYCGPQPKAVLKETTMPALSSFAIGDVAPLDVQPGYDLHYVQVAMSSTPTVAPPMST